MENGCWAARSARRAAEVDARDHTPPAYALAALASIGAIALIVAGRTMPWALRLAGIPIVLLGTGVAATAAKQRGRPDTGRPLMLLAIRLAQTATTFSAAGPLAPWTTSNSTVAPSARVLKPSAWMAL